jgi:O-acetyl-ADP-ribose deacetylase (regulator of RNase III)
MLDITHGNLLDSPVEALVNAVNTEGVMGKGIALQFKQSYPDMYRAYEAACKAREVRLGRMHIHDLGGLVGGPRWIVNFPTKGHWRSRSRLEHIAAGLDDLVIRIGQLGIRSIAIPPLGCGYGGLDWQDVQPLIVKAFAALPDVDVKLYPPAGVLPAGAMPPASAVPALTPGRAGLIALIQRYRDGMLAPFIGVPEVHKLMYFLQEAGQSLNLQFEQREDGPYARNLGQVLSRMEGHFIDGYVEGYGGAGHGPDQQIELRDGALAAAREVMSANPALAERWQQVSNLIEGFEDPQGLELLSSVYWVMRHDPLAADSADYAVHAIQQWSRQQRQALQSEHLHAAWQRVHQYTMGWSLFAEPELA